LLTILAVAVATRVVTYGNPVVDMDDQFYWLVGRSMWHGDWPILDIWDRKPVGLFLIFGAIAGLGSSIVVMQIVATLFAAATAWMVRVAALTVASPAGATMAALAYLLVLPSFGGQSGQSPVFYNLFVASAGALLLRAAGAAGVVAIGRAAYGATALCGLALIVKQVSVAEGTYIGLAFLWLLHRAGQPTRRLAVTAALMVAMALLPTLATFALFSIRGSDAVEAYAYAAYLSIFAKGAAAAGWRIAGIYYLLLFMLPLSLPALLGAIDRRRGDAGPLRSGLILGWIAAALLGYLLVPNFFPHYALPLAVPLAVSAANAFDRPVGKALFGAVVAAALLQGAILALDANRSARRTFGSVAGRIEAARRGGCIFLVNGPTALYAEVPACRVTHYLFPYHLSLDTEASAVGIDQRAEVERIFDARPAVVVTQDDERSKYSRDVGAVIAARLAADYRIVARVSPGAGPTLRTLRIWQRADLAPPRP
jgi:hypothetical protein